ncbi:MAG: M48 family metallopeptidase [Cyanobacteria bacterium P01_G01_bin.39]
MSYHSPQSSRNEPESNSQILILASIFLSGIIIAFLLFKLLVNTVITFIPPAVEQKLGAVIVPVYEQQALDSTQQTTLNQLLERLEANLPSKQQANEYRVLYIPENTVNAIAIPGNKVIIYRGLLEQVESENELMMVLGHELGHFANRDHLRGLGNFLIVRITISYLLGDASIFKSIVASSVKAISDSHYSQKQEKQADKFGLELLNKTYGQVAGATDFFQKLSKKHTSNYDFLASHPAPAKRVKAIKQLIKDNQYNIGSTTSLPKTLVIDLQ